MSRRILFVVDSLFPLGPAHQLNLLAGRLATENFDIHVAAPSEDSFCDPDNPPAEGMTVHALPVRGSKSLGQFGRAYELNKLIRRLQPGTVHAWCGISYVAAGLALRADDGPRFLSTSMSRQPHPGTLAALARRKLLRRPEKMFVPHDSLGKSLVSEGIREHRIRVAPNAAACPALDRNECRARLIESFSLPADAKIAIAVAPLVPRTRLKDLIWAADLLACVREDVHFVLIGNGPQEPRLRTFLSQTEAEGHVHFAGHAESTAASAIEMLAGADIYWHSHFQSPLPTCLLAAMFIGIPVISVYGDETREIIHPQQTGLATNFGARDEFARWSKYLLEQTESADKIAAQGQRHVVENFPVDHLVDRYLEIYNWCEPVE